MTAFYNWPLWPTKGENVLVQNPRVMRRDLFMEFKTKEDALRRRLVTAVRDKDEEGALEIRKALAQVVLDKHDAIAKASA